MIVVVGRIQTDAERHDQVQAAGEALVAASRRDEGCIGYRMYAATDDPNAFVFVEEWESREILDAHFATPHVAEFMRTAPPLLTAPPDVQFHDVASTRTLGDVGAR